MAMRAAAAAILAVLAGTAWGGDEVALRWKVRKGDRLIVKNQTDTETDTVSRTGDQTEEEKESVKQKTTHEFTVREVKEDGTIVLAVRIGDMDQLQEGPGKKIRLRATKGQDGEREIRIEAEMPGVDQETIEPFFRKLVENLLALEITLEIDSRGRVLKSGAVGELFDNLPEDFPGANIAKMMLSKLLNGDELASSLCEGFLQLPEGPVKAGAEWDVAYEFSIAGLGVEAAGKAKLDAVDGDRANISLSMPVKVKTKKFEKRMSEMIGAILAEMGQDGAEVACDFKAIGKPVADSKHVFAIEGGVPVSYECTTLVMGLSGTMTITLGGGQQITSEIEVKTRVLTKLSWTKE